MKTLTVDDYQRVRLPDVAPRTKFAYEKHQDGTITLKALKVDVTPARTVRMVKRNGRLMLPTSIVIDNEALVRQIHEEQERTK